MKKNKATIIVGSITILSCLPLLIYLMGNLYIYLFDGWKLNGDKMATAIGALMIIGGIGAIATIITYFWGNDL